MTESGRRPDTSRERSPASLTESGHRPDASREHSRGPAEFSRRPNEAFYGRRSRSSPPVAPYDRYSRSPPVAPRQESRHHRGAPPALRSRPASPSRHLALARRLQPEVQSSESGSKRQRTGEDSDNGHLKRRRGEDEARSHASAHTETAEIAERLTKMCFRVEGPRKTFYARAVERVSEATRADRHTMWWSKKNNKWYSIPDNTTPLFGSEEQLKRYRSEIEIHSLHD